MKTGYPGQTDLNTACCRKMSSGWGEEEGRYIYFKIAYQLWKLAEESF